MGIDIDDNMTYPMHLYLKASFKVIEKCDKIECNSMKKPRKVHVPRFFLW